MGSDLGILLLLALGWVVYAALRLFAKVLADLDKADARKKRHPQLYL